MIQRTLPSLSVVVGVVLLLWGCEKGTEDKKGADAGPSKTAPAASKGAQTSPAANAAAPGAASKQPLATGGAAATATSEKGMTPSPSGLQFSVLKEGSGAPPPLGSVVKLHLTGWVMSQNKGQQQFVDTQAAGVAQDYLLTRNALAGLSQPQTLSSKPPLIEGLVQAVLEMKPGEKRKLLIPSKLAYGDRGYQFIVPPRADLTFEVELVSFTPPAQTAAK